MVYKKKTKRRQRNNTKKTNKKITKRRLKGGGNLFDMIKNSFTKKSLPNSEKSSENSLPISENSLPISENSSKESLIKEKNQNFTNFTNYLSGNKDTSNIYNWADKNLKSLNHSRKLDYLVVENIDKYGVIQALCKDILLQIDDRKKFKKWFLENCLTYYDKINYAPEVGNPGIIEQIQELYVKNKLREFQTQNENDIFIMSLLNWASVNFKKDSIVSNYFINYTEEFIVNEILNYIKEDIFVNLKCFDDKYDKIKSWFIEKNDLNFFVKIVYQEDTNEILCSYIINTYKNEIDIKKKEMKKKKEEEKEEENKKIINFYKDKTDEELLEMRSKENEKYEAEDKTTSINNKNETKLVAIQTIINNINTAIISRKYFEHQTDPLSCGRHALNNLLGGNYFTFLKDDKTIMDLDNKPKIPINLQSLCYTMKSNVNVSSECLDEENYDINLLIAALMLFNYEINYDTVFNKDVTTYLKGKKEWKLLVNEGNGAHWVAICKYNNDENIYYYNSLEPKAKKYTNWEFENIYLALPPSQGQAAPTAGNDASDKHFFSVVKLPGEYKNPVQGLQDKMT